MSKKIFFFISIISLLINIKSANADLIDGFLFKPAFTLEMQGEQIKSKGLNSSFESEPIEVQLKALNNVAAGFNFRIHRYFGINLNWVQFAMKNQFANNVDLAHKSDLSIEQINLSSLFYVPLTDSDLVTGFLEIGASDVTYDFKYTNIQGEQLAFDGHETAFMYGAGIEIAPQNSEIAFRISAQRYLTKLTPVNGDIVSGRAGAILYF